MTVATIQRFNPLSSITLYPVSRLAAWTSPLSSAPLDLTGRTDSELVLQDGVRTITLTGTGLFAFDPVTFLPVAGTVTTVEVRIDSYDVHFRIENISFDAAAYLTAMRDVFDLFELLFVRDGEIRAHMSGGAGVDGLDVSVGIPDGSSGTPTDPVLFLPARLSADGGAGHDRIAAVEGNSTLSGGSGNDWISGGYDDDLIDGGTGFNRIDGFMGNDTLEVGFDFRLSAIQLDTFSTTPGDDIPVQPLLLTGNGGRTIHTVTDVETLRFTDGTVVTVGSIEVSPTIHFATIEVARPSPAVWASVTYVLDPDGDGGRAILGRTHVDGRQETNTFDALQDPIFGTFTLRLDQRVVTDAENAHAWASRIFTFDDNGVRTSLDVVQDNGVTVAGTFAGGVRDVFTFTDAVDAFVWTERVVTHDETGVVGSALWTFDDGRTRTDTYLDGVLRSTVVEDTADAHPWFTRTLTYDASGALLSSDTILDA